MLLGTTALTLKNIGVSLADKRVLTSIEFDISYGEIFVIVGPSGSGKSTLLRVLSGILKADHGQVIWGDDVSRKDIGFVFQQFALLPWLSVFENIALGLRARGASHDEIHKKVSRELRLLNLEKFKNSLPHELSEGAKQRVGIARALVTEPKMIFMDEPFSELDSFTAKELRGELLSIWKERKPTIVLVTHVIEEAIELGDRIAVLTPQPASLQKIVTVKLDRPRHKRSEAFWKLEDEIYRLIKP